MSWIEEALTSSNQLDRFDAALSLRYLRDKFGNDVDLEWTTSIIDQAIVDGSESPEPQFKAFLPLLDADTERPSVRVSGETASAAALGGALACTHLALDDAVMADVESALAAGGYETTHALSAVLIAEEQGCVWPADPGAAVRRGRRGTSRRGGRSRRG